MANRENYSQTLPNEIFSEILDIPVNELFYEKFNRVD